MGRRRSTRTRVLGPYLDRRRGEFFFWVVEPSGERTRGTLPRELSREEAEEAVDQIRSGIDAPDVTSVEEGVEAYVEHLARIGDSDDTQAWTRRAAARLVDLAGDADLWALTPRHLERFVEEIGAKQPKRKGRPRELSMATRRSYWLAITRMTSWWALRKMTRGDLAVKMLDQRKRRGEPLPWEHAQGKREIGRGRTQLRSEAEAIAYVDQALQEDTAERRVAAVLPLLCGLNSGETLHLRGCDLDFKVGAIWIGDDHDDWQVKRDSRAGSVPMPSDIQADLAELRRTCGDGYLFTQDETSDNAGAPRSPTWLLKLVRRVCKLAGVRVSSPQGLRGTYSSLLTERSRRSVAEVASALRHGDSGRTAQGAYIGAATHRPKLELVKGGDASPDIVSPIVTQVDRGGEK